MPVLSRPRTFEAHLQDDDSLECVICGEPLTPTTRLDLRCGHDEFCVRCLTNYLSKRMETYGPGSSFPCPLCRADLRVDVGSTDGKPLGFAGDGAPLRSAIAIVDVLGNCHPVWLSTSATLDRRSAVYNSTLLENGETAMAFRPSSPSDSEVRGGLVWNDPSRGYVAAGSGARLESRGLVRL